MKKTLVAVLVLAMCVGLAGTALAATTGEIAGKAFSDIAGHPAAGDLTLMAALGIMNGDSGIGGPVRPNDGITRAEFSKMMVAGLGKASTAAGLAGLAPTFKDQVPTWAWGWVNAAYFMGLMRGDDKGNFRPADPVTYAEVMAVLIRSVKGHEAQLPPGVWPYNYLFYGVDNGFNGPVDVGFPNLPATRGDVARMIFAMMQIDPLDKDGKDIADKSLMAGRVCEGLFEGYTATAVTIDGDDYNLAAKVFIVGSADYEGLMNLNVQGVADANGKVIFLQVVEASNVVTGVFSKPVTKDSKTYLELSDGTQVLYTGTVSMNLNQEAGFDQSDLVKGDAVTISLNEDGQAAHIIASRFDIAMDYITDVTKSTTGSSPKNTVIGTNDNGTFEIPASARVTVNGASAGRDTLAENDVVYIATAGINGEDVIAVKAVRQVVQGTVKSVSTTYPGPKYNVTIDKANNGGTATYKLNPEELDLPSNGDIVKYGLNEAGELYVPILFTNTTPYVMITGFEISGSTMSVTVDSRGQSVTYGATADLHGNIGDFGLLTISGSTGKVTGFEAMAMGATTYTVLAVDAAHNSMTVENDTTHAISFVSDSDTTIYQETATGFTYAGFTGVSVDDTLTVDTSDGMIWVIAD